MSLAQSSHSTRTLARAAAIIVAFAITFVLMAPASSAALGDTVTVTAPTLVRKGATVSLTVSTDASYTGRASIWYRSDHKWKRSALNVDVVAGRGTASWKPGGSRGYYVELASGERSSQFVISVEDSARRSVTAAFSATNYVTYEMAWLRGYTYRAGKTAGGVSVIIERKATTSNIWTRVAQLKTTAAGKYSYRFAPSQAYAYRVRLANTSTTSAPVTIAKHEGNRSLEDRERMLRTVLGAAKGSVRDVATKDLPGPVDSARIRQYANGTLVEVTSGSTTRTWLVYDRIGTKYNSLGGVGSKLKVPLRDPKCGLLEGGCVQRFYGGALYQNTSKMSPGVYVAYGTVVETEILAATYSQVGYEEPSWRVNKYTKWLGSRPAWCMTFSAWAAAASGNSSYVPKSATYAKYVATLRASGRLHFSGTPPVGAALLLDWGTGTPSHSAFLTRHDGKKIGTLEGNTTDGTGDPQRGVYKRTRLLSDVWAWYMPSQP